MGLLMSILCDVIYLLSVAVVQQDGYFYQTASPVQLLLKLLTVNNMSTQGSWQHVWRLRALNTIGVFVLKQKFWDVQTVIGGFVIKQC